MDFKELIESKKDDFTIWEYGFTTTDKIPFEKEVRDICESNGCGLCGKTWACPPGVGTLEECMAKIKSYENVFVYTTLHQIEDSFDFEGMMEAKNMHNAIGNRISAFCKKQLGNQILTLTGEGCDRCKTCTYPDAPCRFPDEMSASIEAYGIMVYQLANVIGVNYINGVNTVTFFGAVCY